MTTGSSDGNGGLPWLAAARLFGSGRDALVALVRWGAAAHGWRRLWLPSYSCPEVPAALLGADLRGVELRGYPDADLTLAPNLDVIPAEPGDVVVVVNQLGVRPRPDSDALRRRGAILVEDHSHDLGSTWALESGADFAVASLRKTLPIPDGGAVWSPLGHELPPEPAGEPRDERLARRLAARPPTGANRLRYLALARAAAGSGEPLPGVGISPVSRALLPDMPVAAWRDRRRDNLAILSEAAVAVSRARILVAPAGGVAFALTLLFDTPEAREVARRALVARAVTPAVLWPLDPVRDFGVGPAEAILSSRILSIHGDQRFDAAAMRQLAALVGEALA